MLQRTKVLSFKLENQTSVLLVSRGTWRIFFFIFWYQVEKMDSWKSDQEKNTKILFLIFTLSHYTRSLSLTHTHTHTHTLAHTLTFTHSHPFILFPLLLSLDWQEKKVSLFLPIFEEKVKTFCCNLFSFDFPFLILLWHTSSVTKNGNFVFRWLWSKCLIYKSLKVLICTCFIDLKSKGFHCYCHTLYVHFCLFSDNCFGIFGSFGGLRNPCE